MVLWSRLPFKVMDHVLLFLPVQDLCRYRTVCKRWNGLISTPGFGTLVCAQNSKQDASFIVMLYCRTSYSKSDLGKRFLLDLKDIRTHECCFLDLKARRWYTIKDGDLDIRHNCYGVMGMDGGLFCQFSETDTILENRTWIQIMVYNPIAKTVKELPIVPAHWTSESLPKLLMVVDTLSLDFKILLINYDFDSVIFGDPTLTLEDQLTDPLLRIYESATNEWRSSSNAFCFRRGVGCFASGVVFQGLLYVYLQPQDRSGRPLWRYNLVRDEWKRLTVHVPTEVTFDPELIVSADRLFLVAWSEKRFSLDLDEDVESCEDDAWYFKVSEIKVPDMILDMVFEISKEEMTSLFDLETGFKRECDHHDVSVFSFGTSLMLFSNASGNSIVYDLVTGMWDYGLPQNPMGHEGPNGDLSWVYGKQMNLLLPNTPW